MEFVVENQYEPNMTVKASCCGLGEGVFASKCLSNGSTAFTEKPLERLQSLDNKQDVLVCSYCFRFVGDTDCQMNLLSDRCSRQNLVCDKYCFNNHSNNDFYCNYISCQQSCGEVY